MAVRTIKEKLPGLESERSYLDNPLIQSMYITVSS